MRHLLLVLGLFGCEATVRPPSVGFGIAVPGPAAVVEAGGGGTVVATPPEGAAGPSCTGDVHCMQPDDVIACDDGYNCSISHTMTQPSAQSRNQGQFLFAGGEQRWTDKWFVTRPLAQGETPQLGQAIIEFGGHGRDGAYYGPESRDNALRGTWYPVRVTDVTELFKGVVHTSYGNAHVSTIRVITGAGTQKVYGDR